MTLKIRKAVFPVAGMGTRFLPATKSMPKEMLPVVDKPLIHYAVAEAYAAGIEQFIFVTGKGKSAIEDYFDSHTELEDALEAKGRLDLLNDYIKDLPEPHRISYVRQPQPLGLGHAVLCARDIVGDEPFAVLLSDVLIEGKEPCLRQMVQAYEQRPGNMISVERIEPQDSRKYGVVDVDAVSERIFKIKGMVEKPAPEEAPSNLAVTGRYIIQPQVFDVLANLKPGKSNEIQLTDALAAMLKDTPSHAFLYEGIRYDCGDKVGWLEANIAYALQRPDMHNSMEDILGYYARQTLNSHKKRVNE